jgi:hypothetical protein
MMSLIHLKNINDGHNGWEINAGHHKNVGVVHVGHDVCVDRNGRDEFKPLMAMMIVTPLMAMMTLTPLMAIMTGMSMMTTIAGISMMAKMSALSFMTMTIVTPVMATTTGKSVIVKISVVSMMATVSCDAPYGHDDWVNYDSHYFSNVRDGHHRCRLVYSIPEVHAGWYFRDDHHVCNMWWPRFL